MGARLFYIVEYRQQYFRGSLRETLVAVINLSQGGLVVYGSIFGGALALMLFTRKYRVPGLALTDLIAPAVLLGVSLGRIGCFLNGCCYGGVCELPWAVPIPVAQPCAAYTRPKGRTFICMASSSRPARPMRP